MRALHRCLLDTDLIRLRVIARFWDVELATGRQREAAAQLAQAMAMPETIADAWDALPDDQRQALAALGAAGGRSPLRVFTRQWGEIRTMGPGRMEREQPWQEPVSPLEALWYRGFVFRAFDQEPEGSYEFVFIPPELVAHLPAPAGSPPAIVLEPAPGPAVARLGGDDLLDDACTLLAYLQNEKLRLDAGDVWPVRHEARLARRLRDPNPARLALLHHLVQQVGWLRTTDAGHLRPDPGPVAEWLQSPTGQQRRVLAEAWRDDPAWNDLFHVPTLRPEDTGAWHNDPLLARRAILRHLRALDPDGWYDLDGLVGAIKQGDPDFQRPDGDYATWYIRDAATDAYLSGFENWERVEGALIRYLVAGPLAWLGLADVGSPVPDGPPVAFRQTAAGAALLGLAEPQPEPEPAPLALRADFTVLVPPMRRYERFQLSRVADWVSCPRDTDMGGDFVYRLTPSSLGRARQQGIPVARVLEFLGQVTEVPPPRFVEAALTRWEARGAEAWLERTVVLRLASEELMAQVASSPSTRRFLRERVGPTTALVREQDWSRLAAALGEMGLLPQVTGLEDRE